MELLFEDNLEYLESLNNFKLIEINKQPKLIRSELFDLNNDLNNLLIKDYNLFLKNNSTTNSILNYNQNINVNLIDDLTTFSNKSESIKSNLNQSIDLLKLNNELQFILRLPIKLEHLIKSDNFKESLFLLEKYSFITNSSSKLSIELSNELFNLKNSLTNKLIASLSSNKRLSELSNSIKYLEKLTLLDNSTLSIIFLKSKLSLFKQRKFSFKDEDSIKLYFDFVRQFLTDLMSQFNSIFNSLNNKLILIPFIQDILTNLFSLLESNLSLINDTVALSSIAGSITYLNQSFSSIGLDISPSISKIIQSTILSYINKSFTISSNNTKNYLQSLLKSSKPLSSSLLSENIKIRLSQNKLPLYPEFSGDFTLNPPQQVSNHPFLATWLNSIINTMNSLRLLAPIPLKTHLNKSLDQSLISIARIFSVFIVHYSPKKDPDVDLKSLYYTVYAFVYQALPYSKLALTQYIYQDSSDTLLYDQELNFILDRLIEWLNKF